MHAQKAREFRQPAAREVAVAVGHDAAHGRWIAPLGVAEAAADQELPAVRSAHLERAELPLEAALASVVRDDDGLGVEFRLELHRHVAAAGAVRGAREMQ